MEGGCADHRVIGNRNRKSMYDGKLRRKHSIARQAVQSTWQRMGLLALDGTYLNPAQSTEQRLVRASMTAAA